MSTCPQASCCVPPAVCLLLCASCCVPPACVPLAVCLLLCASCCVPPAVCLLLCAPCIVQWGVAYEIEANERTKDVMQVRRGRCAPPPVAAAPRAAFCSSQPSRAATMPSSGEQCFSVPYSTVLHCTVLYRIMYCVIL